jgi:catechol 2,3-dioxygenase-like lactoylglutathione lyase family enzyme
MIRLVLAAALFLGCKQHHSEPLAELASQCKAGDFGCPVPILYVKNIDASEKYYRDNLGFKLNWRDGDDFGAVTRGTTTIFMCQKCQGNPGSWIYVTTPDVDVIYADLQKRGAKIKAEPENKPWHMREMLVGDLDGNVMRIGSPIEH